MYLDQAVHPANILQRENWSQVRLGLGELEEVSHCGAGVSYGVLRAEVRVGARMG